MTKWRFLSIVLLARLAGADCACPPSTPEVLRDQATIIFNGEVVDIRQDRKSGQVEINFDVTDHLKGDSGADVRVFDEEAGKGCAIDFREKENYLVYARWVWGQYVTSRCAGTHKLEADSRISSSLGPPDAAKERLYDQLQTLCMGKPGTACCLNSVKTMRKTYYMPEPDEGCPTGTVPDRLLCAQSYRWCVPATELPTQRR